MDLSTSDSVVDQFETEIRMRRFPCQVVPPIQQLPSLDGLDQLVGVDFLAEADQARLPSPCWACPPTPREAVITIGGKRVGENGETRQKL